MVKKGLVLLLLLCLFFTLAGYYFVYQFELGQAKSAMQQVLHQKKLPAGLTCFSAAQAQRFSWENDHEFSDGVKMYDVVARINDGKASGVLYAVSDDQETALIHSFQTLFGHDKKQESQPLKALVRLLQTQFLSVEPVGISYPALNSISHSGQATTSLATLALPLRLPPPKA